MRSIKALLCIAVLLVASAWAADVSDAKLKPPTIKGTTVAAPEKTAQDATSYDVAQTPEKPSAPEKPKPAAKEPTVTRDGGGDHGRGGRNDPPRREDRGWHGRRHHWRHEGHRHHGSWSFLWHHGPIIFPVPVTSPHVVRVPRHRVNVYVRHTGDDIVGIRFASSVREHLREQGLRTVYSPDDASLELYIVSMDEDPEDPGYGSAVSVSYIWRPGYDFITSQMLDVGSEQVDDLAASVAGYADDLIDDYR